MREMILKKLGMEREESVSILSSCKEGVLAYFDEDNTLAEEACSYVFKGDTLELLNEDHLLNEGKASFAVVKENKVIPEDFNVLYKSVICFGEVVLTDDKAVFKIQHLTGKKAEELL